MTDRRPKSKTLHKAIQILDDFTLENPEWGIRELARDLDLNPTTIYRLVSTLHAAGFLEQDSDTQRYSLGPKVIKLAGIYSRQNPLPDIAMKIFSKYSTRFEYNFYLGKLSNFEVAYLSVLDGRGPIKIVDEPGGSISLNSTALGKLLLAYQDDKYIDEFISNTSFIPLTERTITDPDFLRIHLQKIRTQGYAINNGEHYDAIGAVGVPIIEDSGQVSLGVSLAYPRQLLNGHGSQIDALVDLAKEIAQEILLLIATPQ